MCKTIVIKRKIAYINGITLQLWNKYYLQLSPLFGMPLGFFSIFIVIFFFLYVFWSNIAYSVDQSNCIFKQNTEVTETMVECCRYSFFIAKPASIERKCDIDSLWLLIHVNQMKLKIYNWNMYAWAVPVRINAERNDQKHTQNKEI